VTSKKAPPITISYKCVRSQREGPVRILNENSFSMAEYNQRTGRFVWMRILPINQREAVEEWVRSQFRPAVAVPSKAAPPKVKAAQAS
jgi:hypothetical protein